MKLYIAGPMRNEPYFGFAAFDAASDLLTDLGFQVINPATHDRLVGLDETKYPTGDIGAAVADGFDMQAAMRWDIQSILAADGVFRLPGWEKSEGAKLELAVTKAVGGSVFEYTGTLTSVQAVEYDAPPTEDGWTPSEPEEIISEFSAMLRQATGDGAAKRRAGTKPSWKVDDSHEAAIFSHLTRWKRGEMVDPDSGAHPLVHAAWRCLAIAWQETLVPEETPGCIRWAGHIGPCNGLPRTDCHRS